MQQDGRDEEPQISQRETQLLISSGGAAAGGELWSPPPVCPSQLCLNTIESLPLCIYH